MIEQLFYLAAALVLACSTYALGHHHGHKQSRNERPTPRAIPSPVPIPEY